MKEFEKYFHIIIYSLVCNAASLNAQQVSQEDEFVDNLHNSQSSFDSLPYSPELQLNWPNKEIKFGQLSGVALDNAGHVHVFHRGDRTWNVKTFDPLTNVYLETNRGPIINNTILVINSTSGDLIRSWGKYLFYMPHGITIDSYDNVWVTDVALHQVFKFAPKGTVPILTLGKAFVPGSDNDHFCKPTDVAIMSNGDFFVSDGYCNSRILKFSSSGTVISQIGTSTQFQEIPGLYQFAIPHAMTLLEPLNQLCIADRENGRIMCYDCHNTTFVTSYVFPIMGDYVYSIAYAPVDGGKLYATNFPLYSNRKIHVRGFVINISNKTIISQFGPLNQDLSHPHDIAVNKDGTEVYVVELNPFVIHKFTTIQNINLTSQPKIIVSNIYKTSSVIAHRENKGKWIIVMVASTIIVILGSVIVASLAVISKLRKRGCIMVPTNTRKQTWEVSATAEDGFKLSHLLERRAHPGFEKLNTEESDEDNTANA